MAEAITHHVYVADEAQLDAAVNQHVIDGYSVEHRGAGSVTMAKRKKFDLGKYCVGLLMCIVPGVLYLFRYAAMKSHVAIITIGNAPVSLVTAQTPAIAGERSALYMSDDRRYWWDGTTWRDATTDVPPAARQSDDGQWWWDGTEWRATATAAAAEPAALESPMLFPPPVVPEEG